ncbi:MAG TPA: acyl-CoA dehydrogenase family protein [Methylomirabilota bacterium]|jgi:alkylation response protein AidB-like acyl-CoA dehydrogenase|nr:acyl-CoA dehydrogenase family protein [Methylomirabilota bacterium]
MELELTPEEEALEASVARAGTEVFRPLADAWGERDELNWELARALGKEGIFPLLIPAAFGGSLEGPFRAMALCLVREALARTCPPAEELFAIQGLGSYPILLAGTEAQKAAYLPPLARGEQVPAFALTEPEAGSDAAALATRAERDGDGWRLTGEKRFISNAPVADLYVVFAKTAAERGTRGISAFLVPKGTPGLSGAPMHTLAPHVIGELRFEGCRVPAASLLGPEHEGWRIAMGTLDVFRASVGAQAVGLARAALDLALAYARTRVQFGQPLTRFQLVQAKLADMATELRAARLLVYSAARLKDAGALRVTLESSMAKLYATEMAHRVIDQAVQLHGGLGVVRGSPIERLYREARAPRIYEGTSEIQRLIIARELLRESAGPASIARD